jgi:hypothetical protein
VRMPYLKFVNLNLFILVGLAIPVTLALLTNAGLHIFTRDIFVLNKISPIFGFLSNLGAFVWCSSLSVIVFTIFAIRNKNHGIPKGFLYISATFSGWLLFDDFFMVHDFWIKRIGFSELYDYALLGFAFVLYILIYIRYIISTNYILLLLSLMFLSLSLGVDLISEFGIELYSWRWYFLLEDGSKWVGICFWAAYFFSTSRRILRENFAESKM